MYFKVHPQRQVIVFFKLLLFMLFSEIYKTISVEDLVIRQYTIETEVTPYL